MKVRRLDVYSSPESIHLKLKYGKKERGILAFPLEAIPYTDFYEQPTQPSGMVRIKFRPRYSEKDIEGEIAVRFQAAFR